MTQRLTLILSLGLVVTGLLAYAFIAPLRAEVNALVALLARADIAPLRDYLLGFGIWAPLLSALLQLLTSILAPLPSFVLAFVNALLYGWWWGAVLTWTTAMLAAAVCFALARALGRPVVEKLATKRALEATDRFFERRGRQAVLIARLIPFINPDVISYAAGLTPMRWRRFLVSIGAGSLPSTALYCYLGARGETAVGWLLIPLVGLGLLTFAGAALREWQGKRAVQVEA